MKNVTIDIDDHGSECTGVYDVSYKVQGAAGWAWSGKFYDSPITLVGLADATTYTVEVVRQCCNNVTNTTTFTVDTGEEPATPTNLLASQDGENAKITWDSSGAAEYQVQRADDSSFTTNLIDVGTTAALEITDLAPPPGTYWYRVRGVDGNNYSSVWISVSLEIT